MKKCLGVMLVLLVGSGFVCLTHSEQRHDPASVTTEESQREAHRTMQAERKVVFHIDWGQEERIGLVLINIKNLFKIVPPEQCRVCVVANGRAVKRFHKDNVPEHAADFEKLHSLGVRFIASGNALADNKIKESDLFHVCEVVPSGILELIDLQAQGYAYIKP